MPNSQNQLPEGTDTVITGAADTDYTAAAGFGETGFGTAGGGAPSSDRGKAVKGSLDDAAATVSDAAGGLRAQATDKVYGIAAQGKDRAVGLLDNVTRLVDDAAAQIDEKAGEQYGAYARQASQAVAGIADNLRDRDIDDLVDDARELVRKSPAIAIGAAAAVGFLFARILKVGLSETTPGASSDSVGSTGTPQTYTASRVQKPTPDTATTMPVDPGY